jgi:predicted DNA-binding transcriptional regulator AlpA
MLIRKGVKLLEEVQGAGDLVQRQREYIVSIRYTLNKGEVLASPPLSFYLDGSQKQHDDGFFEHRTLISRECLRAGLFYAVEGMRIGGYRKVAISPHLAYGDEGLPGEIPAKAKLIAEIKVLRKVDTRRIRWQEPDICAAEILTQDELCNRYQVPRLTLWQRRKAGRLPAPILIGTIVRWRKSDIELWEASDCPRVSPCLDEVKEHRTQAFASLDRLTSELRHGNEGDPIESSPSPQYDRRQLMRDIDRDDETMLDLMLELALLIEEAGQWRGPPLERLLKDGDAAKCQWPNVASLLEKALVTPED